MITPDEKFFEAPITSPRYIKKNYPEFFEYLNNRYPDITNTSEKIYLWKNNLNEPPTCLFCGGKVKFIGISKGYAKYCCYKCANNDPNKQLLTKQTCLKKYGATNPMISEEVKSKFVNYFSIPENQEKIRQERFKKYGVYHSGQLKDVKEKIKQSCLKKYGVESGVQTKKAIDNLNKTRKERQIKKYEDIIDCITEDGKWKYVCKCNHEGCDKCELKRFSIEVQMYFDRKRDNTELCTRLLPPRENQYSSLEIRVCKWLDEYDIKYELHRRDLLGNGQEIDIYLPDYKIGIECNGEWYHCTKCKPTNYHINKWKLAKEKGIQLISSWGVWINMTPDITKSLLLSKLNIFEKKIYARECVVKEITSKICNEFLNKNHIQGAVKSKIHLGLYYDNELVSVMTFGKQPACSGNKDNDWILSRFCSLLNTKVIGGASKLFEYFKRNYKPIVVISYSSNDISNGNLYKKLGFTEKNINISYWYYDLKKDRRYHRSAFTISRLKQLGWYEEGKTEEEIMYDHLFFKNIDSGQTRWNWVNPKVNNE